MAEARKDSRAQVPGIGVKYATAAGDPKSGEARDISRGGVFVKTDAPLAVGARLELEIRLPGDHGPIVAIGRVIWTRDGSHGEERPAGMAVKFIDIDEGSAEVIARIEVERPVRERTVLGVGPASEEGPPAKAPVTAQRERTLLGVGDNSAAVVPPVPRETTDVGVGREVATAPVVVVAAAKEEPELPVAAREVSVPLDLVARKPAAKTEARAEARAEAAKVVIAPEPTPEPPAEEEPIEQQTERLEPEEEEEREALKPSLEDTARRRRPDVSQAEVPAKGGGRGWLWLALLVAAGVAVYLLRDRLFGQDAMPPGPPPAAPSSAVLPPIPPLPPPPPPPKPAEAPTAGAPAASSVAAPPTPAPPPASAASSASVAPKKPVPSATAAPSAKPAPPSKPSASSTTAQPKPAPKPTGTGDNPY